MVLLVALTVVAVVVAVGALQNGQAVTVSFLFWQFHSPLALVILAAAAGGVAIGVLVGWARALQRWRHRPATSAPGAAASAPDGFGASNASLGTRVRR